MRAEKAFEDFSGHKPTRVTRHKLDGKDTTGYRIGSTVGIAYEAKRDGKTERYFHEFKKSARPDLVSKDDGSQLYLTGGKYRVTERGIEDMPALFVVNPSYRPSKRKSKPMAKRRTKRRSTAKRRTQVAVFNANPRRRKYTRRRKTTSYRVNPAPRRTRMRRYRRNPSLRAGLGGLTKWILPAVGIGAGAVGSEIMMGYLPLPAMMKTGVMRHITKGGVGLAAGMAMSKFGGATGRRIGTAFALGAIAIATHDAIKEVIAKQMPSVKFGQYIDQEGYGYYSPGPMVSDMSGAASDGYGQYVQPFDGAASDGYGDGDEIFTA